MHQVTITEARRSWGKLVAMADKGEEITITRRGKPVAKLLPPTRSKSMHPPLGHLLAVNGEKE